MNNKGSSIVDVLFIVVMLLALGISVLVLNNIFSEANDKLQVSNLGTDAKQFSADQTADFPNVFDKFFLVIFAGLSISLFVGAFMLQTHPLFFIFTVIILAFFVMVAAVLGNVYEEVVVTPEFSAAESNYLIIPFVMNNLTFLTMGLGLTLLIGLFAKSRSEPI